MASEHNAKHEARDEGDNHDTDLTGTVTGTEGRMAVKDDRSNHGARRIYITVSSLSQDVGEFFLPLCVVISC